MANRKRSKTSPPHSRNSVSANRVDHWTPLGRYPAWGFPAIQLGPIPDLVPRVEGEGHHPGGYTMLQDICILFHREGTTEEQLRPNHPYTFSPCEAIYVAIAAVLSRKNTETHSRPTGIFPSGTREGVGREWA